MKYSRLLPLLLIALLLAGCQTLPTHRLHHDVVEEQKQITGSQKVVLLPLAVKVKSLTAGGLMDEVGNWTSQAKTTVTHELPTALESAGDIDLVSMPESLSEEEELIVEEHLALYDTVAANAIRFAGRMATPAWRHKVERFDYTLGPGLGFLKERTGADKALIITGEDVISTSGRKGAFVLAAVLGVAIPMGHSVVIGGLVDLESGDILWLNHTVDVNGGTFLKSEDVKRMLSDLYAEYPGVDSYKKAFAH